MARHTKHVTQLTFSELCGNIAPIFRTAAQSARFKEAADHSESENAVLHSSGGVISFADRNKADSHTCKVKPLGSDYLGKLTLGPVSQGGNRVAWSFVVPDSAIDQLQAGQMLVQTYRICISDGHGGTAYQNITIRLEGTNDAPVITSPDQGASVTEIADGAAGENALLHTKTGAITFHDVDTLDTHTATALPHAGGYLGSFAIGSVNQAGDSIGWTFKVPDSELDNLQAGQTLVQKYDVAVNDGHGGTAVQTVTVTIIGSNDAPIITTQGVPVEIQENPAFSELPPEASHLREGSITFSDVDTLDTHSASVNPEGDGYLGGFVLGPVDQGNNSVGWTFSVTDAELDPLKQGERRTQNYDVTVDDGHGGTAVQTVTIVLVGANDGPIANADTNWLKEDGPLSASGNVLAAIDHSLSAPSGSFADHADTDIDSDPLSVTTTGTLSGLYGKLDLAADGSYTYTLYTAIENAAAFATVQALSAASMALLDTFSYTITDGLAAAGSTLTLSVFGTDDGVAISGLGVPGGDQIVDEDDLAAGSSPDAMALTRTGTFLITAIDGVDSLIIAGASVVTGGIVTLPGPIATTYGTLTITGVSLSGGLVSYSYAFTGNTFDHNTGASDGQNTVLDSIAVSLGDIHGNNALAHLIVTVIDDVPTAILETDSVSEDGSLMADGNVITGSGGADANPTDGVADIAGADGIASIAWAGAVAGTVAGLHGSLAVGTDGHYSYGLDNADAGVQYLTQGETLQENFQYTITDGDGDTSTATLSVLIQGDDDVASITGLGAEGGDQIVDEDDLIWGTSPDAGALTRTGTFNISALDGYADLVVGGQNVIMGGVVTLPSPIITAYGELTITGVDLPSGTVSYSYRLIGNTLDHDTGNGENSVFDTVAVMLTDRDGDTDNASLVVRVIDDVPFAIIPAHATLMNQAGATATAALDVDTDIDDNYGADGGSIQFSASLDGAVSNLTSGGLPITYALSQDGLTLTGSTAAGLVFTVALNPDGSHATSNDTYTVTMTGVVDGGEEEVQYEIESSGFQGGNKPWTGFLTAANDASMDLLLTPIGGGTVNTSSHTAGVASGSSIAAGEALRFDFVVDLGGDPAASAAGDYANAVNRDHTFDRHYTVNGVFESFQGISGGSAESSVRLKAFDDADLDANDQVGDGQRDSVNAITIEYNGGSASFQFASIGTSAVTQNIGGHQFSVQFQLVSGQYEAVVGHVVNDTRIAGFTADGYNSLEIHHNGGEDFKIGSFGGTAMHGHAPAELTLPVTLTDGDGDTLGALLGITFTPGDEHPVDDSPDNGGSSIDLVGTNPDNPAYLTGVA